MISLQEKLKWSLVPCITGPPSWKPRSKARNPEPSYLGFLAVDELREALGNMRIPIREEEKMGGFGMVQGFGFRLRVCGV